MFKYIWDAQKVGNQIHPIWGRGSPTLVLGVDHGILQLVLELYVSLLHGLPHYCKSVGLKRSSRGGKGTLYSFSPSHADCPGGMRVVCRKLQQPSNPFTSGGLDFLGAKR